MTVQYTIRLIIIIYLRYRKKHFSSGKEAGKREIMKMMIILQSSSSEGFIIQYFDNMRYALMLHGRFGTSL